ncbi:MAG: glycine cleavage system protein GcvH [bacterium]|nr:glycine cleavage system protein GcvH [bacterium]
MNIPEDLLYAQNHEWVRRQDDGTLRIGITDFAQDALGDVVFVDLPDVGRDLGSGEPFGEIESTKSVSDVYSPTIGEVVEINEELEDQPDLVNQEPYGDGWMIVIRPAPDASTDHLMTAAAYSEMIAE